MMKEAEMHRLISDLSRRAALFFALALAVFCLGGGRAGAESADGMLRVKLTRLGAPSTVTLSANCDLIADTTGAVLPARGAVSAAVPAGGMKMIALLPKGERSADRDGIACLGGSELWKTPDER